MAERDMSQSLREPQLEPAGHMYAILQDHGEDNGGWGPAAVILRGFRTGEDKTVGPAVYSGSDERVIDGLRKMAEELFVATGKPVIFAKFTNRQDILTLGREDIDTVKETEDES